MTNGGRLTTVLAACAVFGAGLFAVGFAMVGELPILLEEDGTLILVGTWLMLIGLLLFASAALGLVAVALRVLASIYGPGVVATVVVGAIAASCLWLAGRSDLAANVIAAMIGLIAAAVLLFSLTYLILCVRPASPPKDGTGLPRPG